MNRTHLSDGNAWTTVTRMTNDLNGISELILTNETDTVRAFRGIPDDE